MRIVVKFGGSSLASADRLERAAESIADVVERGHEVVVVASAMGDHTDELLSVLPDRVDEETRADILSMGERTSIRLLAAALGAADVGAEYIEPGHPAWPIKATEDGTLDLEATDGSAQQLLELTAETVPVVAGYLGERQDGSIVTLGRGSSDTTAAVLASVLDADEVVIVTDVTGVMTADPRSVEGARNVGAIDADRLRELSARGADVVSPDALAFKNDDVSMRIVHYQRHDILSGGTVIEGAFSSFVDLREGAVVAITLAGRGLRSEPGIIEAVSARLSRTDIPIIAISSGLDSLSVYVDESQASAAETALHETVLESDLLWSVSRSDPLGIIRLTGRGVDEDPDRLIDTLHAVRDAHVEPSDVITSATTVALVVPWEQAERALRAAESAVTTTR